MMSLSSTLRMAPAGASCRPSSGCSSRWRQALIPNAWSNAVSPVAIEGRTIARTFWGKAWCDNLERYSDYENRLPRGRTYVRNGSVVDLKIAPGAITAMVSGSSSNAVHGYSTNNGPYSLTITCAASGQIEVQFDVTDLKNTMTVRYSGVLPDLFREGQGVIVHGVMMPDASAGSNQAGEKVTSTRLK